MKTVNVTILPANDEESTIALDAVSEMMKAMAALGIDISVSVNTYIESEEPADEN